MGNCPQHVTDMIIDMINWSGSRMEQLNQEDRIDDLYSIYEEWWEWIENPQTSDILILEKLQGPS